MASGRWVTNGLTGIIVKSTSLTLTVPTVVREAKWKGFTFCSFDPTLDLPTIVFQSPGPTDIYFIVIPVLTDPNMFLIEPAQIPDACTLIKITNRSAANDITNAAYFYHVG